MESEKATEKYLQERIKQLGGKCWKWECPYVRGIPDRICILPNNIFFVEVKSENKTWADAQKRRAIEIKRLGFKVHLARSKYEVDQIIKEETNDKTTTETTIEVNRKS